MINPFGGLLRKFRRPPTRVHRQAGRRLKRDSCSCAVRRFELEARARAPPPRPRPAPSSAHALRGGAAARVPAWRARGRASCRDCGPSSRRSRSPRRSLRGTRLRGPAGACARAASSTAAFADGGRREHRPDQVRPAALVLTGARLVVLVRPDRDVLCAVIRGEVVVAQRENGRREREQARHEFLGDRTELRAADDPDGSRVANIPAIILGCS